MGQRLVEFYKEASGLGQVKAKMRLAMLTTVTSAKAAEEPDSEENIKKFQKAIEELKREFHV
jgi:hypothetical protein